jgi:hypothetical protein
VVHLTKNILQESAEGAFEFGFNLKFFSSLLRDVMSLAAFNNLQIDLAQVCLGSLFELIYGFSPATASKVITQELMLSWHLSEEHAAMLSDSVYVGVMLAQDATPCGMLRSTAGLIGKSVGYYCGFWAENKLKNICEDQLTKKKPLLAQRLYQ